MILAFLSALTAIPTATPIDRTSWFTANDYPIEALKAGAKGSVTFEVDVDVSGKPTACRVTKSSGQAVLDQTTCKIMMSRAHFKAALDPSGKAVPGKYGTQAVWRLPTMGPPPLFHHAVIVDFTDPDNPACRIDSTMPAAPGLPSCEQVLAKGFERKFLKMTILITATPEGQKPFLPQAGWGERLSFAATDQYYSKVGWMPFACINVVAEGEAAGKDACTMFPGSRTITDADKKNGLRVRNELSLFGTLRPPEPPSSACKTGESGAESLGCN